MNSRMGLPFAALCSVPFVMVLSNSMLIPVLPQMQKAMEISLFQVSLILTAFSIPAGLVIPFGGMASDHWGRKTVVVPALVLFGLGGLLAGVAPLLLDEPFVFIAGARVLQGIGGGGTYQVAMAWAGDLYQGKSRGKAMGILEASNGMGKVLSPIMGAAAAMIVWYAPFFIYPLLAWLSAAAVWIWVKEPDTSEKGQSLGNYWRELKKIFRHRGVSLALAFGLGAAALFMLFGVLSWYSDVLEDSHGIAGFAKGFVIAIPVSVMAITSWLTGSYLLKPFERWLKGIALTGISGVIVSLALLYLVKSVVALTAVVSVLGLGTGLVLPVLNTMITSSATTSERGLITSLYGTVRFFGAALGPPTFGLLVEAGTGIMLLSSAAATALVALAAGLWLNQRRLMATGESS